MSHTPGPWHVLPSNPLVVEAPSGNVCLCNLARMSASDAHLIAAAPELLEALMHCSTDEGPEQVWLERARAAIAKATSADTSGAKP